MQTRRAPRQVVEGIAASKWLQAMSADDTVTYQNPVGGAEEKQKDEVLEHGTTGEMTNNKKRREERTVNMLDMATDCVVSYPGGDDWDVMQPELRKRQERRQCLAKFSLFWKWEQQEKAFSTGAIDLACVFIADPSHPDDPHASSAQTMKCFCHRLGSLNTDKQCGYQDEDGNPKLGADGCLWFLMWLANVELARNEGQTLHVVNRREGYPNTDGWDDWAKKLGHAQYLEVLTLKQLGYEYVHHDDPDAFRTWFNAQDGCTPAFMCKSIVVVTANVIFLVCAFGFVFACIYSLITAPRCCANVSDTLFWTNPDGIHCPAFALAMEAEDTSNATCAQLAAKIYNYSHGMQSDLLSNCSRTCCVIFGSGRC